MGKVKKGKPDFFVKILYIVVGQMYIDEQISSDIYVQVSIN